MIVILVTKYPNEDAEKIVEEIFDGNTEQKEIKNITMEEFDTVEDNENTVFIFYDLINNVESLRRVQEKINEIKLGMMIVHMGNLFEYEHKFLINNQQEPIYGILLQDDNETNIEKIHVITSDMKQEFKCLNLLSDIHHEEHCDVTKFLNDENERNNKIHVKPLSLIKNMEEKKEHVYVFTKITLDDLDKVNEMINRNKGEHLIIVEYPLVVTNTNSFVKLAPRGHGYLVYLVPKLEHL